MKGFYVPDSLVNNKTILIYVNLNESRMHVIISLRQTLKETQKNSYLIKREKKIKSK